MRKLTVGSTDFHSTTQPVILKIASRIRRRRRRRKDQVWSIPRIIRDIISNSSRGDSAKTCVMVLSRPYSTGTRGYQSTTSQSEV